VEYDNPPVFYGRGNSLLTLTREKREYSGRTVYESNFNLQDGDWLVMVSDGVLHAGIGGVWNLGGGWDRVADYLKRVAPHEEDAYSLAMGLEETTRKLYAGSPGDDVSIVAIKVRNPRLLTVLAGPPTKRKGRYGDREGVHVLSRQEGGLRWNDQQHAGTGTRQGSEG
jgi:hypothetical protein